MASLVIKQTNDQRYEIVEGSAVLQTCDILGAEAIATYFEENNIPYEWLYLEDQSGDRKRWLTITSGGK